MIRHTNLPSAKLWIGIQKKNNSYTFLHWLDHEGTRSSSRFKWREYSIALKEYSAVGPTLLVEWGE